MKGRIIDMKRQIYVTAAADEDVDYESKYTDDTSTAPALDSKLIEYYNDEDNQRNNQDGFEHVDKLINMYGEPEELVEDIIPRLSLADKIKCLNWIQPKADSTTRINYTELKKKYKSAKSSSDKYDVGYADAIADMLSVFTNIKLD